jgi:hypothetical protein
MSRLPPQGISSSAESGVWPYFSRNCLEGPFFRFRTLPAVDHHIMGIARSLDLDLAKFDQSRFHISMFRWLELQGKRQGF